MSVKRLALSSLLPLAAVLFSGALVARADAQVAINTDFPGGNVLVEKVEGDTISIAPDLRGGRNWFYWYFEAEAAKPGRVTFLFPASAGAQIGVNGPAVSLDGGQSWDWLGTKEVRFQDTRASTPADSFSYTFTAANPKVRFSVGIPYLPANLDAFVERIGKNPHLHREGLAKTRNGTPVDVWRIGQPGPGVTPVLVSARHHACEAMASYVLEGFLEEALSDSQAAQAFRKKYLLYAVPIVDIDGVAAGDQGKWRSPHDHNRDYGQPVMRYPEVIAITELAKAVGVEIALDFHCPTLRMDIHQGFYFAGIKRPHILDNMNELIGWMNEERPPAIVSQERDLLSPPDEEPPTGGMPFSNHFAYQPGVHFAATLECPYTQRGNDLDEELARDYGRSLLRAWVRTEFISIEPGAARKEWDSQRFHAFRKTFLDSYKSKPAEAEAMANAYLTDDTSPVLYQVESQNLLGTMRLRQRKYEEALARFDTAFSHPQATPSQKATAAAERVLVVCAAGEAMTGKLAAVLQDFENLPYPSSKQLAAVHEAAAGAFAQQGEHQKALMHAQGWFERASRYYRGSALLSVASAYDGLQQKDEALAARRQAVAILRKELDPVPVGVFGPLMGADLLEALDGIPTATDAEKQAAADIVLNHKLQLESPLRRVKAILPKAP
ncbi:M14 family zinc carboxypeptidase [Lignipirellula cremea]|uniref:Zinc carboxypeptidase n=1 Tax=Lignipirellula cremea TaxID=2528010 RepID=A0A518DLK8_9BACT|nr:M14 family zinc carboxypeptidase [Lignipirellula cremea]QDU92716.1 Zinc carboxypeptidase [Lignipirellula cremea]